MDHVPVTRIEMPTPWKIGPVNCYLIESAPLTLIDAGLDTPQGRNVLTLTLADRGCFLESIERILITHGHPDHYGLVSMIQEASGANVYFPEHDIKRVRDPAMMYETGRLLVEAGMPLELLFSMSQRRRREEAMDSGMDHDQVILVKDGDRFEFADFDLVAHHMPGHTGGHLVYLEPETRTMFAGDELLPETSPNPQLEPSLDEPGERRRSLKDYLSSLQKMTEMELSLVYPGHGDPVADPDELIRSTIEHHHKRKAEVAGLLGSEGQTPYEIAAKMFPTKIDFEAFLAVSEVVAHLDLVVEDGDGEIVDREGVTYYRSTA